MNPLGGGIIPQHPERFGFLQRSGESVVTAALRFLWDHKEISVTLVGFDTLEHVKEALAAIEGYKPRTGAELAALKESVPSSLEGICTGCAYCLGGKATSGCPQGIPIPLFMDAYNHKILSAPGVKDPIGDRLYWHWELDRSVAGKCSACGQCEKACTQHINIIERLKEIAAWKKQ
jgi:predicted aldo/keto reductase-like oxidoreductase